MRALKQNTLACLYIHAHLPSEAGRPRGHAERAHDCPPRLRSCAGARRSKTSRLKLPSLRPPPTGESWVGNPCGRRRRRSTGQCRPGSPRRASCPSGPVRSVAAVDPQEAVFKCLTWPQPHRLSIAARAVASTRMHAPNFTPIGGEALLAQGVADCGGGAMALGCAAGQRNKCLPAPERPGEGLAPPLALLEFTKRTTNR